MSSGALDIPAALADSGLSAVNDLTPGSDLAPALTRYAERIRDCDPIGYELAVQAAKEALKSQKVPGASRLVEAAIKSTGRDNSKPASTTPDLEPWPEPVTTAELLGDITQAVRSYMILPEHAAETVALWVAATHAFGPTWPWEHFPILSIYSAIMRSGKSLLLDVIHCLSRHPVLSSNSSPSVLFRVINSEHPEILIDEYDSLPEESRDELRNILNGAFQKGRPIYRCVGQGADLQPQAFDVFGPVAVASIGQLPDTVKDRAIPIKLQRKAPAEHVDRFDRDARARLGDLRRKAARWATDVTGNLGLLDAMLLDSDLPAILSDRARDIWRPLLAIAKGAGTDWLQSAQTAAAALSVDAEAGAEGRRVELLAALKVLFEERDTDRMSSEAIVDELVKDEGAPWAEYSRGQPLTKPALARLLKPLGVTPKTIRVGDSTPKGYLLADLTDLFSRYLPLQLLPATAATIVENKSFSQILAATGNYNVAAQTATQQNPVAAKIAENPAKTAHVAAVAAKTPVAGAGEGVEL